MAISRKDLLRELLPGINQLFDIEYGLFKRYGQGDEVDKHNYQTEAKDLPIDVCKSMWVIKYGNEAVSINTVNEQDSLIWEIGNRLFWAKLLTYNKRKEAYKCRS